MSTKSDASTNAAPVVRFGMLRPVATLVSADFVNLEQRHPLRESPARMDERVTDGEPDMCNATVDSTAALAAAAFNATPRIKTFVVAVGSATDRLDAIARAGGTSRVFVGIMPSSPLDAILKSRVFCEIPLSLDGDASSPVRVHVQTNLRPVDGGPARITDPLTFLRQVSSPSACGVEGGWFLDSPVAPSPTKPALIMVCPDTCRALADSEESRIVVWQACDAPSNGL